MPASKKRNQTLQAMVDKANAWIADSTDEQKEMRETVKSFVSALLMEKGCYHGFNYLHWLNNGLDEWQKDGCPRKADDTIDDKYIYGPSGDKTRIRLY